MIANAIVNNICMCHSSNEMIQMLNLFVLKWKFSFYEVSTLIKFTIYLNQWNTVMYCFVLWNMTNGEWNNVPTSSIVQYTERGI